MDSSLTLCAAMATILFWRPFDSTSKLASRSWSASGSCSSEVVDAVELLSCCNACKAGTSASAPQLVIKNDGSRAGAGRGPVWWIVPS